MKKSQIFIFQTLAELWSEKPTQSLRSEPGIRRATHETLNLG